MKIREIKKIVESKKNKTNEYCYEQFLRWIEIFDEDDDASEILAELRQDWLLWWAIHVGNRKEILPFITDQETAVMWAKYIGNKEVMREKIKDQKWLYYWALLVGDSEEIKHKIYDPEYAYKWSIYIGDREIMEPICKDYQCPVVSSFGGE